jgi:hypothetical protein
VSATVTEQPVHAPSPNPPRHDPARGLVTAMRIGGHGVIWAVVLVPTIVQMSRGWLPIGDDAEVAARSLEVLSPRPPLVGMVTDTFPGSPHTPFDLGPLLFWLLALPTHLDVSDGTLWGAALLCGAALSVAFEASFRTRTWVGCAAVIAIVGDLAWREPALFSNPAWNPYFGVLFLTTSVVLAVVVAAGNLRWWPVLVGSASVAAQCHLSLALPSLLLLLGAPLAHLALRGGTADTDGGTPVTPSRRWLLWGALAGIVCWLPTAIQQATGHPGNLSVLLGNTRSLTALGPGFGLRSLATAVTPDPVWLDHRHGVPPFPAPGSVEAVIDGHSLILGAVVLVALCGVVVGAVRTRQRQLGAVGAATLLVSVGVVATFSDYPRGGPHSGPLIYLVPILMVAGIMCWTTGFWAGAVSIRAASRWSGHQSRGTPGLVVIGLSVSLLMVAGVAVVAVDSVSRPPSLDAGVVGQLDPVVHYVQTHIRDGSVELVVAHRDVLVDQVDLVLDLRSMGWNVGLADGSGAAADGLFVPSGTHWPEVTVASDEPDVASCLLRRQHCDRQLTITGPK